MLYVSVESTVRRRPGIVWEVLTDIGGLPTWVEGLVEASSSDAPEDLGVGSHVRVSRRHGPKMRVAKAVGEITIWKPPSLSKDESALLVVETRSPDLLLLDRVKLTPTPDGTTIGFTAELIYGSKLIELLARPRGLLIGSQDRHPVDDIYERSIAALVKRVETVAAAPYR